MPFVECSIARFFLLTAGSCCYGNRTGAF